MTPELARRWTRWRLLAAKLTAALPILRSGRPIAPRDAETLELGVAALIREGDALIRESTVVIRDPDDDLTIWIGMDLAAPEPPMQPRMLHDQVPVYQPPRPRGWLRDMARPTNIVPFPSRPGGRK